MDSYENKLVNGVVFETPVTAHFTRRDWLALAMAALDQAGLTKREQDRIEALLPEADTEEN